MLRRAVSIKKHKRVNKFYLLIYSILMKKVRTGYELFHKALY